MQSRKNAAKNANPNHNRRRKPRHQPPKEPAVVAPVVNVQAEGWGSTAEPWPGTIDESDVSKEIISVWRQNVFAAENGGEVQKMEDLYNRLDSEREKWNERLNQPHTWGWGGQPDELNDWARETKDVTASPDWGDWQPDEFNNWTNDAVYEHPHLRVSSDKTPEGALDAQKPEHAPPPLPKLLSNYADKLNADGRERSYAFAQLSAEAKAEKIREVAYQLKGSKKH